MKKYTCTYTLYLFSSWTDKHKHFAMQVVREMRARESDFHESLQTKDSQLGIIRVRLEEADKELAAKKQSMEQLQVEKQRWVKQGLEVLLWL